MQVLYVLKRKSSPGMIVELFIKSGVFVKRFIVAFAFKLLIKR